MKKKIALLLFTAAVLVATSCNNESAPESDSLKSEKYPVMTFEETEHDFGTIQQGDKVEYAFKFTNSGESDLVITEAHGSCGCTVPDYPKTAIKPGEGGDILVSFNSAGKSGPTTKSVYITCNTKEENETLIIKSNIVVVPSGKKLN